VPFDRDAEVIRSRRVESATECPRESGSPSMTMTNWPLEMSL
jgi:hypothetical protein